MLIFSIFRPLPPRRSRQIAHFKPHDPACIKRFIGCPPPAAAAFRVAPLHACAAILVFSIAWPFAATAFATPAFANAAAPASAGQLGAA